MGLGGPGSSAPSENLEHLCVWGGLQSDGVMLPCSPRVNASILEPRDDWSL